MRYRGSGNDISCTVLSKVFEGTCLLAEEVEFEFLEGMFGNLDVNGRSDLVFLGGKVVLWKEAWGR